MTIVVDAHVTVGMVDGRQCSVPELVEAMDAAEVVAAMVSPDPEGLAAEHEAALAALLQAQADHPGRLFPYAAVNPWRRDAGSVIENALDNGCAGVKIDPFRQGHLLLDPVLAPILEVAADRNAPVYLSSGTPVSGLPLQARVLALRWPTIKFILGRSGRTDFVRDLPFVLRGLDNLYTDTSHGLADTWPGDLAVSPGNSQTLFASDWPWSRLPSAAHRLQTFASENRGAQRVLGENLMTILSPLVTEQILAKFAEHA